MVSKETKSYGFSIRSTDGAQMQNTFLSESKPQAQFGSQNASTGFDNTQSTFKMRNTSLAKPVDRQTVEDFKTLLGTAKTQDWQKRL